ncbi:MAG: transcription termination/antitermination NusG family protein [Rikenellaceae bacterium]
MINYSNQGVVWYAMKTTFKRELKAKAYLDSCGIESFIPMQQIVLSR